jgi:hypothetical protein
MLPNIIQCQLNFIILLSIPNKKGDQIIMGMKEDILKSQELRLQILKCIYNKVSHNMQNKINGSEIEKLFPKIDSIDFKGILKFLAEKNYIKYKVITTGNSVSILLPIYITSKGIELIETIETGGNVSKFEEDFSKPILNIAIGDVSNSNVAIGNGNSQTLSINSKDTDSILKFIDKLLEENPNEPELVDAKEAVIKQTNKGELPKYFLKGIGATLKKFVTGVSIGVLTTGATLMLGL